MSKIHPTALIEPGAEIADGVIIGPYCHVGSQVVLRDRVELISHVSITGQTHIGAGTKVYPFACLGHPPQSRRYEGEAVRLVIGQNNKIREHVTIHPGTPIGRGETTIGNNCFFMVASHVAHDCEVGNNVEFANNATIGGHVVIEDFVILGGMSAVHQRVRIGTHAIIGGMSGVEHDVIPFGVVKGERANLTGLNLVGLKRRGFSQEIIQGLRLAYQQIFDPNDLEMTLLDRVRDVATRYPDLEEVIKLVGFIQADPYRHFCLPKAS